MYTNASSLPNANASRFNQTCQGVKRVAGSFETLLGFTLFVIGCLAASGNLSAIVAGGVTIGLSVPSLIANLFQGTKTKKGESRTALLVIQAIVSVALIALGALTLTRVLPVLTLGRVLITCTFAYTILTCVGLCCLTGVTTCFGCAKAAGLVDDDTWFENLLNEMNRSSKIPGSERRIPIDEKTPPNELKQKVKEALKELGLEKPTTFSEVKKAYKKFALEFHPDKNPAPEAADIFTKKSNAFQDISYALEQDPNILK